MASVDGYILFAADRPLVGLDPHPAFAPNDPDQWTPEGWAEAYHMVGTLAEAELEASEDHEACMDAGDADCPSDVADPDEPMAVRVFSNGDLQVFSDSKRTHQLAYHSMPEIFEAFGIEAPQAAPA